ncbi:MAG: acyltransferase, partial [Bacteroidaceae bacterium]|nr:acyltransferase [Bacteroidaceae bacterium]
MNTKDNQRNATIDLLKLFAIFLVLWGHCVQQFLSTPATGNEVYLTIYSLHMPLFMMLSGYFSHSSLQLSFKDFIRKKSTQLLLPVISWSIIILLLYTICDLTIHKADYSSSSFKENLISAFGNFWFLKSLFVCYLLAFCGKKTKLH